MPGGAGGGGTRIAFLRSSPTEPSDLWLLDVGQDAGTDARPRDGSRRSTPRSWPTSSCASRSSATRPSTDATSRAGSCPAVTDRRPLVLEIHGGPHTLYGWAPVWEFQILAAAGIGVFACNPRGSEGYGQAFSDANHRDWGPGPMRDVLAGVDALVADGLADPDRLGVTGGSYGGYLTNWILGHDRRFRTAMTCRSVSDMGVLFTTGDISGGEWAQARIRRDAVGRPRVLPRDLAAGLRRPDPDAAPHPARRARHPDDGRPGRGAVHRAPLASPAGAAAARSRGDPRADALGDAVPPGREPAHRRRLVPPLPVDGRARPAATPQGARRTVVRSLVGPAARRPLSTRVATHVAAAAMLLPAASQAMRGHKLRRGPRLEPAWLMFERGHARSSAVGRARGAPYRPDTRRLAGGSITPDLKASRPGGPAARQRGGRGRRVTGATPGTGRPGSGRLGGRVAAQGPGSDEVYPLRPMTATRRPDTPVRERADELIRAWDGRPGPLGSLLGRVTAGRPGRRRGARRRAQAALDQEGVEAVGARPRDLDDGPDHARGEGHAGQDPGDVRQGDAPAAGRPDDPVGRRRVRLSGARRRGEGRAPRLDRQGRQRRHRLPVGPDVPRHQGRRGPRGGRGRRRRDRHGHRSRRLPVGRLPDRVRGDRRGQGGGRRGAPQGHPRDRRARDVRQRPAGERPGDGRRRRLHQDLDRQGHAGRDACRSRWSCSRRSATSSARPAARSG